LYKSISHNRKPKTGYLIFWRLYVKTYNYCVSISFSIYAWFFSVDYINTLISPSVTFQNPSWSLSRLTIRQMLRALIQAWRCVNAALYLRAPAIAALYLRVPAIAALYLRAPAIAALYMRVPFITNNILLDVPLQLWSCKFAQIPPAESSLTPRRPIQSGYGQRRNAGLESVYIRCELNDYILAYVMCCLCCRYQLIRARYKCFPLTSLELFLALAAWTHYAMLRFKCMSALI